MKICANCGQRYDERTSPDESYPADLGELFLEATDQDWESDLCPLCLEELGMMNLMGFDEDIW
jgi:hypothetical protein